MQSLLQRASTVAHTDASVMIRGETGSGKEVIAKAIHANSARKLKPFVAVNCAAVPAELLESELFGHAKGAFTGAHQARRGLFAAADGGTLFLDEIAEMPLSLQAKLLRAAQDGEIRRVGETDSIHVDARLLCATHQDLQLAVKEKRFREDLYYRLKVFTLQVPPLRDRRGDVSVLATMFLQQEGHATGRFTPAAMALLERYSWPGNVRELVNAVKHGAVLSDGHDVDVEHLPEELTAHPAAPSSGETPMVTLEEIGRRHILGVWKACEGQHSDCAKVLGIGRTTLWRKLRELGVES